jgi:hypothetical protein
MSVFQGAIALAIGLVFAFVFDTRGPRREYVSEREAVVPDEDVHDYERPVTTTTTPTTVREREAVPAGEVREDDERVEIRDPSRRDTL